MSEPKETKHMESEQGALAVPDSSLKPGQVLQSRYRILGIIGMGGMGAVYQARDLNFQNVTRVCAVKEMINLAQDPQLREQTVKNFEREAETLALLSHPAIPQIYDYFSFGDRAYLVMEFIQGRDLEQILNSTDKFLPVEQVLKWAIAICDVLSYLHNNQPPVVFRDMKPANVMIDHRRQVRLIDFGIAKQFQIGQPGTMIGTEGYSPPEQYKGEASPAGDIYALGATLHHLLTRRDPRLEPPFSFDQRPIQQYNSDVPEALTSIVMRALDYETKKRYSSAEAMKQSLEAVQAAFTGSAAVVVSHAPDVAAAAPAPPMRAESLAEAPPPQMEVIKRSGDITPIWSFEAEDKIRSKPLAYRDRVFVGSYDNNLWALDAKDGNLVWKFATDGGIGSSPSYSGGAVYVGSVDRNLYAVDVRDGRRKWSFKTEGRIFSTPTVALGSIFFGSDDHKLYSINPGTGRENWSYPTSANIRSSPTVFEGEEAALLFVGNDLGEFLCLDVSGNYVWRFTSRRKILSTPLVWEKERLVYVGSYDWCMYGIDIDHGSAVWRIRTRAPIVSSPAFSDGTLYFGSADGFVYALNARNGREEWKYEVGAEVTSSPFVYRDAVYIGAPDGALYALHAKTGELLWRFQSDGPILSSPFVADDVVYIGSDDKHLYALQA
jgi:outer membrane protein assembly factor BamB/tRNA A-37 threonylcarbamoyl transferase component Bud32